MSPREALQTALGLLLLTFYLLQITYERFGELGGKSWCLANQHRDFGSWAAKKANPVCCNCLQQGALFKKLACLRDGISVLRRLHLGGESSKASALVLSSASLLVK